VTSHTWRLAEYVSGVARHALPEDVVEVYGDVASPADCQQMVERKKGSIVAFGGLHAMTAGGAGPNSAAKMGLLGFVRSLAVDLAPYDVRVNMVVPGRIATEGRDNIPEDIPMRRRGTPREIALTTLFLAGDDSAYVTGERIMATGGRTNL
jgi:3-oxoacyl-[acyl-carrier protein] reductase